MMYRKGLLLLAAALLSATASAADTLKVMTYNLRFGEMASMAEIGEFIRAEQPDIVALQECDWDTKREWVVRQNGVKFLNELAAHSGMFGLYGRTIDYKGGYYGIGLLSRYPIARSERIFLPNPENSERRAVLLAEIELPDGKRLTVASTHLDVASSAGRIAQVKFINRRTRWRGPVILAGDMNAAPQTPEIGRLLRCWKDLTGGGLTFSSTRPQSKIDYIVGRPAARFRLLSSEVRTEVKLSDHFPVVSEIILSDR